MATMYHIETMKPRGDQTELERFLRDEALPYWRSRGFEVKVYVTQNSLGHGPIWLFTGLDTFGDMDGWPTKATGEPEGQRMTMPVPFSQVETDYRKDEARMEVTIVDTGMAQLLIAPWSMMLATGFQNETSNGYEKATNIGGNPAVEKWNKRDKRGELNILVGKRYMITIDGRDVADIKEVHAFASAMDFNAIAALK